MKNLTQAGLVLLLVVAVGAGVWLNRQDHSLEVIDSLGSGFGVGFCHGQSGSVLSRWAMSSRWVMSTIPVNNGNTSGNASGYCR